ncbi:triose-phosphate isomerase [Patescibacteria group bacterium]|nr:triose-phosphate isomerase [Patescibacteria group bacterium]
MKKIIIANWKMKLTLNESLELIKKFKEKFKNFQKKEVVVCPSSIILDEASKLLKKTNLQVGAQNVFWEEKGSFTGEISPEMLVEVGCKYVIIGHSERRKYLLENYSMIHKKIKAVLNVDNLIPIICIGEEAEDKKTDKRDFVLVDQLQQALGGINIMENQQIIIAYEPVWAIGSGISIEPSEAEYSHKIIKLALNDMFGMKMINNNFRIIYGGSINSKNVKDFNNLENLDGFLVGGASLDVNEFYKIAKEIF